MSRHVHIPKTLGQEKRARSRQDSEPGPLFGECITRPMTPEERAWVESLPKPRPKERVIGMAITTDRAMRRKRNQLG